MGTLVRSQEKVKRVNLFQGIAKPKLMSEYVMVTINSYQQKNPLEVELSASRRGYKRCSEERFLILKSLDSDNLQGRLKESMKALSLRCPWGYIPLKEED